MIFSSGNYVLSKITLFFAASNLKKQRIMKYVIIGGVAGGATAAARLRRVDEMADILLLEKVPYISCVICGLPY